jgi:sporadic carbohydrate cluster 2OG-Fe(II) oxygenase
MSDSASEPAFLGKAERELGERFLRDGYIIQRADDRALLDRIQRHLAESAARALGLAAPSDPLRFLDGISEQIDVARLNQFRLAVIAEMNAAPWLRPAYFALARQTLETIVGNELAMQRRVNLSIQLPNDDSSLLPVHADVWSGDSPFEVVVWVPFVDCYATKTMFIVPPEPARALMDSLHSFHGKSSEELYRAYEKDAVFLEVPYGNVLVFNQNLPHGNRINRESETRWSMNCRFKSVFTPYADKKLGEFFEPITLRPASRIGLEYELPGGFDV